MLFEDHPRLEDIRKTADEAVGVNHRMVDLGALGRALQPDTMHHLMKKRDQLTRHLMELLADTEMYFLGLYGHVRDKDEGQIIVSNKPIRIGTFCFKQPSESRPKYIVFPTTHERANFRDGFQMFLNCCQNHSDRVGCFFPEHATALAYAAGVEQGFARIAVDLPTMVQTYFPIEKPGDTHDDKGFRVPVL